MFNRIDKKKRIQEWIDWCEIPINIIIPPWGEQIPRGVYRDKKNIIEINGKQSDKEIIKSIIHEVCHWVHGDQVDDPDIWERESRAQRSEKQWKVRPDEVVWE